jgi:hypothetical protein
MAYLVESYEYVRIVPQLHSSSLAYVLKFNRWGNACVPSCTPARFIRRGSCKPSTTRARSRVSLRTRVVVLWTCSSAERSRGTLPHERRGTKGHKRRAPTSNNSKCKAMTQVVTHSSWFVCWLLSNFQTVTQLADHRAAHRSNPHPRLPSAAHNHHRPRPAPPPPPPHIRHSAPRSKQQTHWIIFSNTGLEISLNSMTPSASAKLELSIARTAPDNTAHSLRMRNSWPSPLFSVTYSNGGSSTSGGFTFSTTGAGAAAALAAAFPFPLAPFLELIAIDPLCTHTIARHCTHAR